MQGSEALTTATSESEGRLKVSVGGTCPHGKKGKCLKCVLAKNKKDGAGGPGIPKLRFPTGIAGTGSIKSMGSVIKKSPISFKGKARKIKGASSAYKSLTKKSTFSKSVGKSKILKSLLKGKVFRGY